MSGVLPLTSSRSLTKDFGDTRLEQLAKLHRIVVGDLTTLGVKMLRAVFTPGRIPRLTLAHTQHPPKTVVVTPQQEAHVLHTSGPAKGPKAPIYILLI